MVVPTVDLKAMMAKPKWDKMPSELATNIEEHRSQLMGCDSAGDVRMPSGVAARAS